MVKQAPQVCKCGWEMKFPEGQVKTTCICGNVWELDLGGVWFIQLEFVPFVAKPSKVRSRAERYANYPKSKRRKKAGRC